MEFIIVLGNPNRETYKKRVKRAVEYYNELKKSRGPFDEEGPREILVFCGKGDKVGLGSTEAGEMFKYAQTLGISQNECIIEDESMNTYQNFEFFLKKIKKPFLSPTYMTSYIFTICTSTYHIKRSLVMAKDILGSFGEIRAIHTNEKCKEKYKEKWEKELFLLDKYLDYVLEKSKPRID